ncbi:hypothetical protein TOPH_02411 [Tolypocladium ophioglossoides CBS 100239]|uniref:FHA domain-containing protein n=1 Tax=Tolypocladium ophioglossoides (strain CBS 100239) TaxID=1163406 RepID=A0A0L0NHC0_TOLOC|nr:hypothetical protein TOPH_02411 [Tolypocladium ophioglossoides CBS 100239]
MPPRLRRSRPRYGRRERESTEPPDDQGASALDYLPCLEVKFSDIPRTDRGLVFGYNPNCDVVLPHQGISNYHFSLTFDNHHRLIVKDWGSLIGTQVTYNGEGEGTRRHFQWIIGGHDIPQRKKNIIITVQDPISF